jgi:DNA-binding NtrC family response regulator
MNLVGERIEVKRRERILVIDDDPGFSEVVQLLLAGEGYRTDTAANVKDGLRAVHAAAVDLVITDLKLPDATGLDAIRALRELDRELPIILMTSYSSVESAVEALRNGAVDYVIKPFNNDDFLHAVERALAERRIRRENALLKRSLRKAWADRRMIGESPGMRRVTELVRKVAPSDANVLIWGESGTGKELVARNIHRASHRAEGPFVAINCGAIPAELLESELFGHAKGAFTGATHATEGLIREAHGGTLFLDEIAELPLPLQVKLLRVLQDREVRPVGGKW